VKRASWHKAHRHMRTNAQAHSHSWLCEQCAFCKMLSQQLYKRAGNPTFLNQQTHTHSQACRTQSTAHLNTASSRGLKAPLAYVMSLAMAMAWRPCASSHTTRMEKCCREQQRATAFLPVMHTAILSVMHTASVPFCDAHCQRSFL